MISYVVKHMHLKSLLASVLLPAQDTDEAGGRVTGEVARLVPAQVVVKIYSSQELAIANVACIVVIIYGLSLFGRVVLPLVLKKHFAIFEGFSTLLAQVTNVLGQSRELGHGLTAVLANKIT